MLTPYGTLAVGYAEVDDADKKSRVRSEYETFLQNRAMILESAARRACKGEPLDVNELFKKNPESVDS